MTARPQDENPALVLSLPNDADLLGFHASDASPDWRARVADSHVIELAFPSFTDGRAYSQAVLLRRRFGYKGVLRATGEVLVDQLQQMQRSGFDQALLHPGQDPNIAQQELARYRNNGFYQGDAEQPLPPFARVPGSTKGGATSALPSSSEIGVSSANSSGGSGGSANTSAIALYGKKPSPTFAAKLEASLALLRQAQAEFADRGLCLAASMGAEDMVLIELVRRAAPQASIFVLDTGKLHAQTLDLIARAEAHWGIHIDVYRPDPVQVAAFEQNPGMDAIYQSQAERKACCDLRKMEPLARALAGKGAWITGLRQEQSTARAQVTLREEEALPSGQRSKFNPLADWTWGDVWHFIETQNIPYNPLHDAFFPSIGCAPCTRAISLGEDFRAGRWWWEQSSKECGLHVAKTNPSEHSKTASATAPAAMAQPHNHGAAVLSHSHLAALEEESIFILREVAAAFERPALLFSGGKDSLVMLKLAEKAFGIGRIPYPLLMIDTGHNFQEVLDFRDLRAQELEAKLIVRSVEDSMARGTVRLAHPGESRNVHQSVTLLEAIEEFRFDALIGGARRDEEKARAKERIFSHRDGFGQWNPKHQRPELWNLFNTRLAQGEHFRVFPISNWTELDVWEYIADENIGLPSLYYAHQRAVVERKGLLVPITEITPAREGETVVEQSVRFRTVGDITCTCPVASNASTAQAIIEETLLADVSERGATRMDDQTSEASMEKRKKEGYF